MKNVIVTGADGFVGSYTVNYFLENGCKVLALDMGETPRRLTVGENLEYMRCDIGDASAMLKKYPKIFMTHLSILHGQVRPVKLGLITISRCRMRLIQ